MNPSIGAISKWNYGEVEIMYVFTKFAQIYISVIKLIIIQV